METKTYGGLAKADRVKRPECADEGDLLVIPPGNAIRSMGIPSIARMGLSCGYTCRSSNRYEDVDRLFRGGKEDAPIVLRISDVWKTSAPSGRRAQMLALIGNGREAGEEPQASIVRCKLQLVYNGKDLPRYTDTVVAEDMIDRNVDEIMERLQQSNVSMYSGNPVADVATVLAWQSFNSAIGVIDEAKPRSSRVPDVYRSPAASSDWNVGGNLGPDGRAAVARFLAEWNLKSTPEAVTVTGRFLAEAGKRGCVVVKCGQASAFAVRTRVVTRARMCAETWRCRARALNAMRLFALKDLAVARARAANFDKIAREIADGKADYAFLKCMSGWNK